ncbi:aminopeptidase N [Suttonella ornithocola]|uniref:Aminopeptidase N n=1 Tax=Suttonella ornithocola TaxID=279832 RepID=A0A380MN61_9GAMM|nr:aminopeptidase N [Suttonella ornithocola]SUO93732.1 Aminopeptidase N [Suttonella ornithocola]
MSELRVVRLADYRPPAFTVRHHELQFCLNDKTVRVCHQQQFERIQPKTDESGWSIEPEKDLVLNGEQLDLQSIAIDGRKLSEEEYRYEDNLLTVFNVPDVFRLETEVVLQPEKNLELSGLYRSNGIYCTQCEAQGFRRISFTLDRPDVLATYRVRIEGNKADNPVMLSNGNLEQHGDIGENRYYAQWYDPHPKPCYLFALVSGKLSQVSRRITTPKGKKVELRIYTEASFIAQTDYAMQALVDSFVWDEKRFNLSYDLNRFNLVAISDFNMGAMENKSLNIFNTKYVLANTDTATDADFLGVQAVIGHEYFHNWTGNRITCRDWFQLSLKEGLTVFRDQEFSADLNERDLERIKNVNILRRVQFPEDGGPMRHPVQPQEYAAIDNFYTATVYEKGAEIIRMYHTIIGEEAFQKGMALYVERHDGQAVRIEDFAQCMEDASGYPFTQQFFDWYTTAGTPKVTFTASYNQHEGSLTLAAGQDTSAVEPARPLVIPIQVALISPNGRQYRFEDGQYTKLLILDQKRGSWTFDHADEDLIPVLMMGYSAPVYYQHQYSDDELSVVVEHAPDGFARFEAMQTGYRRLFLTAFNEPRKTKDHAKGVADRMLGILENEKRSPAEKALLLTLPSLESLLPYLPTPIDMDRAIEAYERIERIVALKMRRAWADYLENDREPTQPKYSVKDAGIRALRGVALKYLAIFEDEAFREKLDQYYQQANNMTERMNALEALNLRTDKHREQALADFNQRFADQPLVIDKWFALQAKDHSEDALSRIAALTERDDYQVTNPNRFRALIGSLMQANPNIFHQKDGEGYRFVCRQIRRVLLLNPQLAARLLGGFAIVSQLDDARKAIVRSELNSLLTVENISTDVREVLERILAGLS